MCFPGWFTSQERSPVNAALHRVQQLLFEYDRRSDQSSAQRGFNLVLDYFGAVSGVLLVLRGDFQLAD
jgi:hypothetical protein